MSKRKSPSLVGFANGERLLGEEAFSFAVRYPETVFARARDLLGKPADDPTIQHMLKDNLLPYKIVPHPTRKLAAVQIKGGVIYSAEELVGSTLQYARQITEATLGGPVRDAVIAVPAYYGQAQRQGLIDSASLVGINVLGLVNTHTAAALQFGIERDFANTTQHVVFYDQGAGTTIAALVKYSSYNVKEGGVLKPISQLEVRDVDWDAELGAGALDALLVRHFAQQFADKHKLPVEELLNNPRTVAKMKRQVRRTKEMLSANSAAPISVEEMHDGRDFQSSITREEFETLAGPFFERAAAPLKRILERSGLKPEELEYVELLGGGTRVPRLQAALSEVLGGRALDRHVDADEAVVLGASLFAANLSSTFRLRKFGMADISMYGVSLVLDEVHTSDQQEQGEVRNLLPHMKRLPIKRVVHFGNLTADPLRLSLRYNTSTPNPLPPGATGPHLASIDVTGVDTTLKRYNSSGTVNLRFEAAYDGVLRLDKAEAVVDYVVMEEKIVTIKDTQANTTSSNTTAADGSGDSKAEASTADENSSSSSSSQEEQGETPEEDVNGAAGDAASSSADAAADAATNSTDTSSSSTGNTTATPTIQRIMVPKKKVAKVALNVSVAWAVPPLSGEAMATAKATVAAWVAAEEAKRQAAAAKNELESYIIATRTKLQLPDEGGDETWNKVTTSEQRGSFTEQLSEAEEWLYMEGSSEGAAAFQAKLATLKAVGGPMAARAEELTARPAVVAAARKEVELKAVAAGLWPEIKPWITEAEVKSVQDKISSFQSWLDDKEKAQAGRAPHEDPVFTSKEVAVEYEKLDRLYNRVANKKKPKPPPEPAAAPAAGEGAPADDKAKSEPGGDAEHSSQQQQSQQDKEQQQGDAGSGSGTGGADSKSEQKGKQQQQQQQQQEDAKAKKEKEAREKKEKADKAKADKAKADKEAKAKREKEEKAKKDKAAKNKKGKGKDKNDEL